MAFAAARQLHNKIFDLLDYLRSPSLLLVRLYVASIFFKSGLTKIRDWESTLLLFEYEYEVPFFSPEFAAWSGTFGELVLPVLLVLGLFSRISAIGLFIVNYVAVISLVDISPAAYTDHILWGTLMLAVVVFGGGKLAADYKLKIS